MNPVVPRLSALTIIASLLHAGPVVADPKTAASDWRSKQEKFWKHSDSLFDAIVTLNRVGNALASSSDATLQGDITASMLGLLFLFDDDDSPQALDALARLSWYYLGEAPGEVYSCVVVRKGARILPALREQLKSATDDCASRYGKSNDACLSKFGASEHKAEVQMLIDQIRADTPCTIEQ